MMHRPNDHSGESMSRRSWFASRRMRAAGLPLLAAGVLIAIVPALAGPAGAATTPSSTASSKASSSAVSRVSSQPAKVPAGEHVTCPDTGNAHTARCLSMWRKPAGAPAGSAGSAVAKPTAGWTPADLQAAYHLPKTGGKGQTIAIVDAYDNPNAEKDLAAYRSAFGLPACTTANGCFKKVNQRGGTTPPEADADWGVEINLDIQAVSASCPGCKILLVEGDDPSFVNLGLAVNEAVKLGASVVSNSYGNDEFNGMSPYARYYNHPGVPILVSSGDYGFGPAQFPSVLPSIWSIGGTTLTKTASGYTDKAWDGAGSGCSAYIPKQSWQKDTHCSMRVTADVSAVADPTPGFAEYDTYGLGSDNGWLTVGGTSLSSPFIAGVIGLAGNAKTAAKASYAYAHKSGLRDVTGGSNGYCGGDYLCTGVKGYDGPTGLGVPNGISAF
jgi:hypothetical protein